MMGVFEVVVAGGLGEEYRLQVVADSKGSAMATGLLDLFLWERRTADRPVRPLTEPVQISPRVTWVPEA